MSFPSPELAPKSLEPAQASPELDPLQNPNFLHNTRKLESAGAAAQILVPFYAAAVIAEPVIADAYVRICESPNEGDYRLGAGVGKYKSRYETDSGRDEIFIYGGDNWDFFAKGPKTAPVTNRIIAERAGVAEEQFGPRELAPFIFLHEGGHIGSFSRSAGSKEEIDAQRNAQLGTLPVPGMVPSHLIHMVGRGKFDIHEYFAGFQERFVEMGINSPSELIEAQQAAYRDLAMEAEADAFAARIFKQVLESGSPA